MAVLRPDGKIFALAAERVGDRSKHSGHSKLAYDYLRARLGTTCEFGGRLDHFVDAFGRGRLETGNHHLYHAASAFFGSGFDDAAVLVIDGQGPAGDMLASTSIWRGEGQHLVCLEMPHLAPPPFAPSSIGHFYTAIGALSGMRELHAEGKTMALAAFGKPTRLVDILRQHVRTTADGTYWIDPEFTLAVLGNTFGPKFYAWPEQPADLDELWTHLREAVSEVDAEIPSAWPGAHVAYAGQVILEEIVLGLTRRARRLADSPRLCYTGGVALNCAANARILQERLYEQVFIPPAPGDDGQALGKLFCTIRAQQVNAETVISNAYYGVPYSDAEMDRTLAETELRLDVTWLETHQLIREVARRLAREEIIGWVRGRSELGPRALGHRSIFADPRSQAMQPRVNALKGREPYRPLAPVVPESRASEFFAVTSSPYMSLAVDVRATRRHLIPAVVHVDGSARVQTVTPDQEPTLHALLETFDEIARVPILLNTSFNGPGEPIVETPRDAVRTFAAMGLDALVLENRLVTLSDRSDRARS